MDKAQSKSKLSLFDVTNLVVGAIIGADIYVASAFGAGLIGPFALVAWIFAGIIAIVIALSFAQCAALLPKVGGPYAYAHAAGGAFAGFIVGWALWLAEWMSLAVFPVAFTRYLMYFLPNLDLFSQAFVKGLFVAFLIVTNILGVKTAGKVNDLLTLTKLIPLVFFTGIGLIFMLLNTGAVQTNFTPLLPYGAGNFGLALVLIFWAYAGFEISTIPAEEIDNPGKTIPKAIVLGISIVTVFYLVTNFVLFGVRRFDVLKLDTAPLTSATNGMLVSIPVLAGIGALIVGIGALVSVAGSDESGMIGTSRLGYALAIDGLFPRIFAKIHPKFQTPYVSIVIQAVSALAAAIIGQLDTLIATSVFFMAIAYAATAASVFFLRRKGMKAQFHVKGGFLIPILSVAFSIYLITQCTPLQIVLGVVLLLVGVPIYVWYSPKKELTELKDEFLSSERILKRSFAQEERFLAHALRHLKKAYRRLKEKKKRAERYPTLS